MIRLLIINLLALASVHAGTLAIFQTSVGNMNLELYDADKPVTVQNFIRYVRSGRFDGMFVQRWQPAFVIQGGGYYLDTNVNQLRPVQTFGTITNEYSVGRTFSNTRGTIAMARQGGNVHSATSQWFLNLTNNAFLDEVDEGFTVFGKVITGLSVLDIFHPPPPTNDIYIYPTVGQNSLGEPLHMPELPAKGTDPTVEDLIYVTVKFVEVSVNILPSGDREISWNSLRQITSRVEVSNGDPNVWTTVAELNGSGGIQKVTDSSPQQKTQIYRVRILLN